VAQDPRFEKVVYRKANADNFDFIALPQAAPHFWRVRAVAGKAASAWSAPVRFTVAE
jgi:hypothetical protein